MNRFKQLCRDVAAVSKVLTFSDFAKAAANGAGALQHTPYGAWVGAILGISAIASQTAVTITQDLMHKAEAQRVVPPPANASSSAKPKPKT